MINLSRLEKQEEQQNIRKAGLLAGVAIILILGAFFLGIPLLVRVAIWWGDISSSRFPKEKTDLIPPVPPKIFLAYEATNSAVQNIAGSAEPGAVVALGVNGEPLGNVVAENDGSWEFENVSLTEGENKFFAIAVDQAGNKSSESVTVTMSYHSKSPELTIETPNDQQVITGKTGLVEVKGTTVTGVRLTVNDRVVIVGNGGKFATTVQLNEGGNVLVISVVDQSGNQSRKELVVEYRK